MTLSRKEERKTVEVINARPPDGGRAWLVLFAASVAYVINLGFAANFTLIYRYLLERFEQSAETTAWIVSIHFSVKMFSSPLCGAFINRYGFRLSFIISSIFISLGFVISSVGNTLTYTFVGLGIITGIASNINTMILFAVPGRYFDKRKGIATSCVTSPGYLGAIIFAPLMQLLRNEYGYSGMMLVMSAIMLHNTAIGGLFAPLYTFSPPSRSRTVSDTEAKSDRSERQHGGVDLASKTKVVSSELMVMKRSSRADVVCDGEVPEKLAGVGKYNDAKTQPSVTEEQDLSIKDSSHPSDYTTTKELTSCASLKSRTTRAKKCVKVTRRYFDWTLLGDPKFTMFCFYVALLHFVYNYGTTFLVDMGKEKGLSDDQITIVIIVTAVASIVSRFAIGALLDIPSVRKYQQFTFALNGVITSCALALYPWSPGMVGYTVITSIHRASISVMHTQHLIVLSSIVPNEKIVSALGVDRPVIGIAMLIAPLMGGTLKDSTGTYTYGYYISGAMFGLASIGYAGVHAYWVARSNRTKQQNLRGCAI